MADLKDILPGLREKHGNQSQVARRLGIRSQLLGQYEKGKRNPKADFYKKWKNEFGEDLEALIDEANASRGTLNHTSVDKPGDNSKKNNGLPLEEIKRIIEGETDYYVIPKSILEGNYRIVAIEQIQKDEKELSDRQEQIMKLTEIIRGMALGGLGAKSIKEAK